MNQELYGDTGCVINGDVKHLNVEGRWRPPTEPHQSRSCPQCANDTWRYSPICVHCAFDLRAWDHQVYLQRQERERQRKRHERLKIAGSVVVLGLLTIIASRWFPAVFDPPWAWTFGGLVTMALALRLIGDE